MTEKTQLIFFKNIMAPALVEPVVEPVVEPASVGYKSGIGQYKEVAFSGPNAFKKELELRGTDKHAPASYPNYLPTWENEKGTKYAVRN